MNRILRIFPSKTSMTPDDDLAFSGQNIWPGLFVPDVDEIHISCTFSWDVALALKLYNAWLPHCDTVRVAGPGIGGTPGDFGDFIPGLYLKKGITITSRGCDKHCPWCIVPQNEGSIRTLPIMPGRIVQDNNLLACPRDHIERVFEMLSDQKGIVFSGGLDATRLEQWHIDAFRSLSISELWFAADTPNLKPLMKVAELIAGLYSDQGDNGRRKKRCFVMIGYDGESVSDAEKRLQRVWDIGFLPFAQIYKGYFKNEPSVEMKKLQRTWSRPAAMYTINS